jgi:putative ATPase
MSTDQNSLFGAAGSHEPLASRMRPRTIDEYIGQDHIMGPGRLLRRAIQADQLSSVIFSGPPGTGKTTLARVIANCTRSDFISLNAVLSGVADIREAIEKAKRQKELYGRRSILFVDEVHRWNKAQQDALLPWVENGTFILIGATTENPYFEVNAALVSRSRVFQLVPLNGDDLRAIVRQALSDPLRGYGRWRVGIEPKALDHLVHTASGDARSLLNAIELAVETTPSCWPPADGVAINVTLEVAEDSIQQKALLYDREGDYHFDSISAFIKSIRGSDPDAALYWMARMVRSGESPRFILRRMLISAAEDIGLADPDALVQVQAAAAAFDRVGMPEGQFFLSQAALYLAIAPKSNSTLGYFEALKTVEEHAAGEVPNHLKDANRDKKGFGHGEGYQYPHAFRDHWVAQNYLPVDLRGKLFYNPGELGHEGALRAVVLQRRETQLVEAKDEESVENLTFSPRDRQLDHFVHRAGSGLDPWLVEIRNLAFSALGLARHDRLAIIGEEAAYWVPEALRQAAEGLTYSLMPTPAVDRQLGQLTIAGIAERCRVLDWENIRGAFADGPPERLAGFNLLLRLSEPFRSALLSLLAAEAVPGARLVLLEQMPSAAPRPSALLPAGAVDEGLMGLVLEAETAVYSQLADQDMLSAALGPDTGWQLELSRQAVVKRRRLADRRLLDSWFVPQRAGSYGAVLQERLGPQDFGRWKDTVESKLGGSIIDWPVALAVIEAKKQA